MKIVIANREDGSLDVEDELEMYRLRYRVFCERLSWSIRSQDAMEFDPYDELDATYVIAKSDDDTVCGCWRALPTTGPYMLKDTFPELLGDEAAPSADNVWELSRFAFDKGSAMGAAVSPLVVTAMAALVGHALDHGVDRFVTVTTVAIERLLNRLGIASRRLAAPQRIGIEGRTVALSIDLSDALLRSLRAQSAQMLGDARSAQPQELTHEHEEEALAA
jgi:acyl homoserine lactone synthase